MAGKGQPRPGTVAAGMGWAEAQRECGESEREYAATHGNPRAKGFAPVKGASSMVPDPGGAIEDTRRSWPTKPRNEERTMKLQDKKIAVLVENFYEDLELWYPALRFREEGAQVTFVGPKPEKYTSKHGYPVQAEVAAEQVKGADFDAVIVPGGYAPDHMRRTPAMVEFLRQANASGAVIGAICHAGWMLVSADIIRGKTLTGFHSIKDDLVNAGARFEDREVVRDGNLVTSRTPADLPAFARALIEAIAEARTPASAGRGRVPTHQQAGHGAAGMFVGTR